jgi:pimeloyl-ACP methyl ester carboxylesterase
MGHGRAIKRSKVQNEGLLKHFSNIVGTLLLLLISGCLPLPQVYINPDIPPAQYRMPPDMIKRAYVTLEGYPEPSTPDSYNHAYYVRYYALGDKPGTVLVIMPGIFGGATSVDTLARQLVAAVPNLEVWAIDRRANALEDRSSMIESLRKHDPGLARDYYIEHFNRPDGFKLIDPKDLMFIGEWGLEVHLYDLHEVIKQARAQALQVILGGHSLGGSIVNYYAAFKFPDGPGFTFLDGLVLIEGVLGRTGGFDREPLGFNLGPIELIAGTESLQAHKGSPYFTFGLTPDFHAKREVVALEAHLDPEGVSETFDFPVTNRAALGIQNDDQYISSTVFSSSLGEAVGATFAGNITAVILGGTEGVYSQTVTGVAKGYDSVDWSPGDPLDEHSNLAEVAKSWSTLDSNRAEWYFPVRLAIDIGQYDVRLEDTPGFIPNRLVTTPTLAVGAGRGLVTSLERFSAYSNARIGSAFSIYIIPDFTHLDIVQAQNNPLVAFFQRWLEQL